MTAPAPPCASRPHVGRIPAFAFAGLLVFLALPLVGWGGLLITLGGSPYYALLGIALIGAGALLVRGSRWSVIVYTALLAATWLWALIEAGPDFWILLTRLGGPLVLGCGFLIPAVRRYLRSGPGLRHAALLIPATILVALASTGIAGWAGNWINAPATEARRVLPADAAGDDWPAYGGDQGGTRFSRLAEIDRDTVRKLDVAWTYRTGDYPPPAGTALRRLEVTPLKVGDLLYLCTSASRVIALDAETGRERWRFDPHVDLSKVDTALACRSVAYARIAETGPCATRLYLATVDARLMAIDARTGHACRSFGTSGAIDLTAGLGPVIPGYVAVSSGPVVARGKVIVGGRVSDGQFVGEPGGPVRAFDARTGAFAWAFDPGNPTDHAFPEGGRHFTRGTPNSWAPMSVDTKLGLVFVPTGNATPDYWGGHRTALDDRYSSAVIALDVETGSERWTSQTTHHDLWDADVASQPTLVDVVRGGVVRPALLQPTKRGQLFLLDRRTGRPISPVVERPVPQGAATGDRVAATQPFSPGLPALDGLPLSEADMWGLTPYDALWCRIRFRHARWLGTLTAPSTRSYIQMPGGLGGSNWGSAAVDPARGFAFVPWVRLPMLNRLIPRAQAKGMKPIGPGGSVGGLTPQLGTPFADMAMPFSSPLGVPCAAPPYGLMTAVDLKTGRAMWTRRLGLADNLRIAGVKLSIPLPAGTPLSGGALATAGGLIFIGATGDNRLRAIDTDSGKTLWSARLKAAANATPMTYRAPRSGRQIVVVAAGGHPMLQTQPGDYIVAFALRP
ncbi:membrane-bound PQQ-dependent dehydrogenase, glucose/quinate/shikimate family [Sphingomonas crocodyli]|uniref:Membrane-bound PQQ-dependent dehydrogenase, glucose/quinate/shikimate family n=1 Tax=Sphingomonas crocodyli TaxID=1979270 RepID=A0A437M645_9SPHN|nr:membrane-bound PQQ-dependent dehydrogenase, glucose/quinate/shikimate family [Sphingomonas crocodyli]RVT93117.1 membrane-bound PQQ-dependent dehydrogenase, glucose/quinate/shikimate family [Sphingomonas crocodyli]